MAKPVKKSHATSIGLGGKALAYGYNHGQALFSSLGRLMKSPFTSFMTVLVMAITVALAGSFYLLVNNARQLTGNLEASNQISMFLKYSVTDEAAQKLASQIGRHNLVDQVKLITKSKGMDEFRAYSGFGDALKALDHNPLPAVIQILPTNALNEKTDIQALTKELQRYPEVDFVQLDMQWLQRLQSIMLLAERAVMLFNVMLAVAVIFITGNTIRLELENRREEVMIAKLVGATHAFVQRPFVYTGLWLGLFAGILAWLIISIMVWVLDGPLENLSMLYDGGFHIVYLNFSESLQLLFFSSAAGALGAWLVLFHQLRQIKPK